MSTARYVYWQEDAAWLGYHQEFPNYWTQGEALDDLIGLPVALDAGRG